MAPDRRRSERSDRKPTERTDEPFHISYDYTANNMATGPITEQSTIPSDGSARAC
jgi:hypothetical protein